MPNSVHRWLADKKLITQNIDGLDGKAGNKKLYFNTWEIGIKSHYIMNKE